jgi:hypothetical protein
MNISNNINTIAEKTVTISKGTTKLFKYLSGKKKFQNNTIDDAFDMNKDVQYMLETADEINKILGALTKDH